MSIICRSRLIKNAEFREPESPRLKERWQAVLNSVTGPQIFCLKNLQNIKCPQYWGTANSGSVKVVFQSLTASECRLAERQPAVDAGTTRQHRNRPRLAHVIRTRNSRYFHPTAALWLRAGQELSTPQAIRSPNLAALADWFSRSTNVRFVRTEAETQVNTQACDPCNEFTGRPDLGNLVKKSEKVAGR